MAIRTTDTNPATSTERIKEVLVLETEIDRHLLEHLYDGKASYMMTCTDKSIADLIVVRYTQAGWIVCMGYAGKQIFRLDFEDVDQLPDTRKILNLPVPYTPPPSSKP